MSDESHQPKADILVRATEALRSARISQDLSSRFFESTIAALQSRAGQLDADALWKEKANYMFRSARYSKLAAAMILVAIAASMVSVLNNGTHSAFGQVVENVKKATAVTFTCKCKMGTEPAVEQKYYYQRDMLRLENVSDKKALICNTKTGEALNINHVQKTAFKFKFDRAFPGQPAKSPVDLIATVAEKDAQLVGEEEFNGIKVPVFRLTLLGPAQAPTGETAKIWVDPASGLPIRIESEYVKPDDPMNRVQISAVCENFEWNVPLEPELFEAPQGYAVTQDVPGQIMPVTPAE